MKTKYFMAMVLLLYQVQMVAQSVDNFESYSNGELVCSGPWSDWSGTCSNPIVASSEQANSGILSGKITGDGTTNAVFDFGNKIFSRWIADFWLYVPSNKEATLNVQGQVPIGSGESIFGDFVFNPGLATPGEGYVESTYDGQVNFTFPHDQWFNIVMDFDLTSGISLGYWSMTINGVEVVPEFTYLTGEGGTIPTALGGLNLVSRNSDHLFYIDDICYYDPSSSVCLLGSEDFVSNVFSIGPNPVAKILNITSETMSWETIRIYSLSGQVVQEHTQNNTQTLDVSALASGLYFVEITSAQGKEIHRLLKE